MKIRTLIVDDTVTYRRILSDALKAFPELEVVGTASSGSIALKKMANAPVDLVFLDVHMPDMNGVETLKRIKNEFPDTNVIMISGISDQNAASTIAALQLGAVDFIRKPTDKDLEANRKRLQYEIQAVLRLITIRMRTGFHHRKEKPDIGTNIKPSITPPGKPTPNLCRKFEAHSIHMHFSFCVIGVSTGGPEALGKLIPLLPELFPIPILLVQHMPPAFTKSLAESLNRRSKLYVSEAVDGEAIEPAHVYIAPGGHHMVVRMKNGKKTIGINDLPPENSCRPSVDVLFRSAAGIAGNEGILAIILTGMGSDGCNGVRALKRKICYCITQAESTCVVYGMPRAVDEAGLSDCSLSLEKIGESMSLIAKIRHIKR